MYAESQPATGAFEDTGGTNQEHRIPAKVLTANARDGQPELDRFHRHTIMFGNPKDGATLSHRTGLSIIEVDSPDSVLAGEVKR